jgi:DNA-binding NarL/FixJ family response regulator
VDLLRNYRAGAQAEVDRYNGRAIGTRMDGVTASFDGPGRALRCAMAMTEAAERIGLKVRCGAHTGELEVSEDVVGGLAVHIAAHIAAVARPGETLASGIVRDLVAGSGLRFGQARVTTIDGIAEPLRLHPVEESAAIAVPVPASATGLSEVASRLSQREREILTLVARGLTNPEIAKTLDLSDHTVKRHVANILTKLDLSSRAAAATFAAHHGLA